jgi:hypothetical protein
MRTGRLFLAFISGLGLTLILLLGLKPSSGKASITAQDLFAQAGGTGACAQNTPCDLQTALNLSNPGDTIYIAQGTYTSTGMAVVSISKSITLYGGWNGAASGAVMRDPDIYTTILDGENTRRAVYITGTITTTLGGLTLQNGSATGWGGDPFGFDVGGALYVHGANATITNCLIQNSFAMFGGGVAFYYGSPRLSHSTVLYNSADHGGGGIFLYYSPALIMDNAVFSNTASSITGIGGGAGLYLDNSPALIQNNIIRYNYAHLPGGGLFVYQSSGRIRGNTIQSNTANIDGGGLFAIMSSPDIEANTILGNEATLGLGGGVALIGCSPFTMTNNIIATNSCMAYGPGVLVAGCIAPGCPTSYHSNGNLLHNTFANNTSSVYSMTIHIGESSGAGATVAFTNTLVDQPGGIAVDTTGAVTADTTLWHTGIQTITVSPGGSASSINDYHDIPGLDATFHLFPTSPAIDRGAPTGLLTDIDGDSRSAGTLPDIGADEVPSPIHLPLVMYSQ